MEIQDIITLLSVMAMALAIWKDYQKERREGGKQHRDDLEADYERIKEERDGLLAERVKWLEREKELCKEIEILRGVRPLRRAT